MSVPVIIGVPKPANVYVDKPDVLEDIIDCVGKSDVKRGKPKRQQSFPPPGMTRQELQEKLLREDMQIKSKQVEAATKENVKKSLQRSVDKQDAKYTSLLTDLDEANAFLDSVDKNLNIFDETKRNKTRRQFEDWNTNVHAAIQVNIGKQVDALDPKALNRKKNEDYGKFLEITNRKAAIFRDIIIESEYDPLEPNRRIIKAKTSVLKDPCHIDAQKAEAESSMLGSEGTGGGGGGGGGGRAVQQRLGKDTLAVELWASGKIEATPYGSSAKLTQEDEQGARRSRINSTSVSRVVFDHFDFPKGKACLQQELPRGKRIHPCTIYANPCRVFNLPEDVQIQLATIRPPENRTKSTTTAL